MARRPGPSLRALLFRCGEGAVCELSRLEDRQLRELVFLSVQKATLGTCLPPNASRRPCHRLLLHSGGSSLVSTTSRRLRRRLLQHSGRFPRAFLVASESNVRHLPASKCLAAPLPQAVAAFWGQ